MNYTAFKTESKAARNHIILSSDCEAVTYKGTIVTFTHHDAIEIAGRLNAGADISDFFVEDLSEDYYGSPTHQMLGDSWLYSGCQGAW